MRLFVGSSADRSVELGVPRNFDLLVGIMNRIAIDIASAITPPNLLGIDRRMAYANRKYHSG